jgi:1-deoxy-D-xylulose-5-phosphate synthase
LHEIFKKFNKIITVEDGTTSGGFGSAILEFMAANQYSAHVTILGIPDRVIDHGTPKQLQHEAGFDGEAIANCARAMLKESMKTNFLTR